MWPPLRRSDSLPAYGLFAHLWTKSKCPISSMSPGSFLGLRFVTRAPMACRVGNVAAIAVTVIPCSRTVGEVGRDIERHQHIGLGRFGRHQRLRCAGEQRRRVQLSRWRRRLLGTDEGSRALSTQLESQIARFLGNLDVQGILDRLRKEGNHDATVEDARRINRELALHLNGTSPWPRSPSIPTWISRQASATT